MSAPAKPHVNGVQFKEPPATLQPSLRAAIAEAVASIPPGKSGAIVAVVNEKGANAAIVGKVGGIWDVQAWVGKTWTQDTQYGASVSAAW